jgi:hypothetical protein
MPDEMAQIRRRRVMKSKALIAVAVASTFGWSAASFAGAGHQSVMPFSPNESGENVFNYQQGFGLSGSSMAFVATSDEAGGALSGSYSSSASDLSMNGDQSASIPSEESLAAADDGLYTDYYVVSWAPVTGEGWDYYVLDDGSTAPLALNDFNVWMPQDQLVLIPSTSTPDETVYDLALVPMTFDANSASIGPTDDLSGE